MLIHAYFPTFFLMILRFKMIVFKAIWKTSVFFVPHRFLKCGLCNLDVNRIPLLEGKHIPVFLDLYIPSEGLCLFPWLHPLSISWCFYSFKFSPNVQNPVRSCFSIHVSSIHISSQNRQVNYVPNLTDGFPPHYIASSSAWFLGFPVRNFQCP